MAEQQAHTAEQQDKHSALCSYKLQEAAKHRGATSYGAPLDYAEKCGCCDRTINKSKLGLCFDQSQLFYCGTELPSYLYVVKSIFFQFLLLVLVYSLPLVLVNFKNNGCQTTISCQSAFTAYVSLFNSFDSPSSLDLVCYLAVPAVIINYLLFLVKSRLISSLRLRQQEQGLFPDSCAVFLELPFNHLTNEFVSARIESWWQKEAKANKEYVHGEFSELEQSQSKVKKLFSQKGSEFCSAKSRRESQLIYEIIFSYSYPQFEAFEVEMQAFSRHFQAQSLVNKEEMNMLVKLHEKKKKLLQETAKNKFCLVLFKSAHHAEYFYQKTQSTLCERIFCCQSKSKLTMQGETVSVQRGCYPSELYWQNMHLTYKQSACKVLMGYFVFLLLLAVILATWYWVCKLHAYLLSNGSSALSLFIAVVALSANALAIFMSQIVKHFSAKQQRKSYSQQNRSYITKAAILNVLLLYLSPFVIYCVQDASLAWVGNGFNLLAYWMIGIFFSLSLLRQVFSWGVLKFLYYQIVLDQTQKYTQKQANQYFERPAMRLQQNAVQLLTATFLNSLAIPINPFISTFSLAWVVLFYCLQKINICYLRKEDQCRGQTLILSLSHLIQYSPLLLLASCFSASWLASTNKNPFNTALICVLSVLFLASLIYLFLPIDKFIGPGWQNSLKSRQLEYANLKANCQQLYQKYNNPYLVGRNGRGKLQEYSVRIKIFQEMNTMSKTLTQTLKDRLLSYQHPVLNTDNRKEEDDDQIDHLYFQYQKKVEMKSSPPKVQVPRLFRAESHNWAPPAEPEANVNINSLFSEDDESNKRLVKKMIKEQVQLTGLIQ